ncbi:hypothetical protein NQ314_006189 [Rhamnusium bicolor]|uniref:Uncharacterized protein n=1 Tax=Rhamnusium bicolor TaxID=1586634 RepID=A0AAV8Z788_9CUCU|nr:hypothetical protein NQ314_006189 [Rhamnusium bicolor]
MNQPFEQDCVVVDVKDRSFDAIVLKTGSIVRIYQNVSSCIVTKTGSVPLILFDVFSVLICCMNVRNVR